LETFREELSREVLRRLPPLYQMDGRAFTLAVERLTRRPFPAQFHAAAAVATTLRVHRSALLIGEPSVGKTITALVSAAMIGARRVLVLAPAHLLAKWGREIRLTVPGARVIEIQRLRDVEPAVTYPARENAPVFYLLSRDQAKLGAPWHHAALPCYLLDLRIRRTGQPKGFAPRCERCGIESRGGRVCRQCAHLPTAVPISDRSGGHPRLVRDDAGQPVVAFRCPHCGQLLRDRPDAENAKEGQEPRIWTQAEFEGGPKACPFCKEPLLQYDRLPGGRGLYPLARYLGRRHRKVFDLLIIDEGHQYKGRGTAQGMMLADLTRAARCTVALTATLMSGKASSLFYLLFRLVPAFRRAWSWKDAGRFVREYGLVEVSKEDFEVTDVGKAGKRTKKVITKQTTRELPGVTPAILRHVLDRGVFIHLRDLGLALPPYKEHAVEIDPSPQQRTAYDRMLADMRGAIATSYRARRLRLLGGYLQTLLSWPDAPWRGDALRDPRTGELLTTVPALADNLVYPKEQALVELCRREAAAGRRVLVYATHTQTRDITHRLARLLEATGLRAEVLKAGDVSPRHREAWVRRRAPQLDALVTSPRLVGEGLDLVEFPTVVWVEPEYSTYIVRQASRRTWRIGQTEPVHVYFLVYRQTIQAQALALVARGIRAASLVDGEVPPEDSLAGYGEAEFFLELARMVVESASVRDLDAILQDAAAHATGQHAFLDPKAAPEQSSPLLPAPAICDAAVTPQAPTQMSLF
jgi:superfamily II DNA or RNA helicase